MASRDSQILKKHWTLLFHSASQYAIGSTLAARLECRAMEKISFRKKEHSERQRRITNKSFVFNREDELLLM